MSAILTDFHFLRPLWLLALLVLPLLLWRVARRSHSDRQINAFVDPALREHVTEAGSGGTWLAPAWLALLWLLATLALAGPAWRQQEVALYRVQAPLVVLIDLSSHMAADDLKPDRITQARFKLISLLRERAGGQVALIAYSGDAFTVAPLTDDAATVSALVDALAPQIMPSDGQRADLAMARAQRLLASAGFQRGDLLLITDTVGASDIGKAGELSRIGIRTSVLGVGSSEGAMLRDSRGSLVYGLDGNPQLARLDETALQALASAGDGHYARLRADGTDLAALGLLQPREQNQGALSASNDQATRWRDEGPWLLPLLLILGLAGFRRGALAALAGLALLLPMHSAQAWDWDGLWRNREQRADLALRAGDAEQARRLARDPARAGAAAYRAGDWDAAIAQWSHLDDADSYYNRGNALAQAGRVDDAIAAYDQALVRDPSLSDAKANREMLQQQKQQQQQQQNDKSQSPDGKGDKDAKTPSGSDGKQNGEQGESGPSDQGEGAGAQSPDTANGNGGKNTSEPQRDSTDSGAGAGEEGERDAASDGKGQPPEASDPQAGEQEALSKAISDALAKDENNADGNKAEAEAGGQPGKQASATALTAQQQAQREQQQAVEAWLRRVPDDPGGLLRRKFAIEFQRRQAEGTEE